MEPEVFENGAKRSEKKPDYYLLNSEFLQLVAEAMSEGRKKYGELNYRKGGPEFVKEAYNHLFEHVLNLKNDPENWKEHLGHIAANVNMMIFYGFRDNGFPDLERVSIFHSILNPESLHLSEADLASLQEAPPEEEPTDITQSWFSRFAEKYGVTRKDA